MTSQPASLTRPRFETEPRAESRLRCARCDHEVTHERARRAVDGKHVHVRMNPGNWVHRFGCFCEAPGVRLASASTTEHSWFAGYAWALAVCAGCQAHLGWRFSGANVFYGLLLGRLRGG